MVRDAKDVEDAVDEKIDQNKVIDNILNENPSELRKVTDNLSFIQKLMKHNIPKGKKTIEVFGCEQFDLNEILKENIWDRSIFTTDTICRMFLNANIDQLKKYLPKKVKMPFNWWWIIILIILAVGAILFLLVVLPMLSNIKLF